MVGLLTSCGLIDMEFDPTTQQIISMSFAHDTVYVMRGDTFFLAPYIYPDTVGNNTLYMYAEDDSIVGVRNDTIYAAEEGITQLVAVSVSHAIKDTCTVVVMEPWDRYFRDYLYDQVIYATLNMPAGHTFNPNSMMVGAFIEGECVGVGRPVETPTGQQLLHFRCWLDSDDDPDTEMYFMIYYKPTLQLGYITETVPCDGATRGTPSRPFVLNVE